jgi:hypothetical protein
MRPGELVRINCKRHRSYDKIGLILEWAHPKGEIRNEYLVLVDGMTEWINSGWCARVSSRKEAG